jgi:hypothetical protein
VGVSFDAELVTTTWLKLAGEDGGLPELQVRGSAAGWSRELSPEGPLPDSWRRSAWLLASRRSRSSCCPTLPAAWRCGRRWRRCSPLVRACASLFPPALSRAMPADDAELDRLSARRAQAADGLLPAAYVALEFGQGWEARGNRW